MIQKISLLPMIMMMVWLIMKLLPLIFMIRIFFNFFFFWQFSLSGLLICWQTFCSTIFLLIKHPEANCKNTQEKKIYFWNFSNNIKGKNHIVGVYGKYFVNKQELYQTGENYFDLGHLKTKQFTVYCLCLKLKSLVSGKM